MDLPSIECLEQALKDCPCAMLLISHDESFLEKLTTIKWKITKTENDYKLNVD
jgi:ATPase subunit of ABC transporter with duplicated ATPase domains